MVTILGINTGGHDGALALIKNGKLVAAMSKERFTRKKKDGNGDDPEFIKFFLQKFNTTTQEIDYIVVNDIWPRHFNEHFIEFYEKDGTRITNNNYKNWFLKEPYKQFEAEIEGRRVPAFQVNHQLSHCAYSFYLSNQEKALCLSMDASGQVPWTSSMIAIGNNKKLEMIRTPNLNVGCMYAYFTYKIGLGNPVFKAGSLMGLASYGEVLEPALKWEEFKEYEYEPEMPCETEQDLMNMKFSVIDRALYEYQTSWFKLSGVSSNHNLDFFLSDSKFAMDLAASTQFIFEEVVLEEVRVLFDEFLGVHGGNICLSGGSFLNCNLNSRVLLESGFGGVFLSPACGDDGLCVGAALFVCHDVLGFERVVYERSEVMYLGGEYDAGLVGVPLDLGVVARLISEGLVVAWCQGRSEFGPRALGNRSFLADPRRGDIRDYLNFEVKGREWFRPFAPSVLVERVSEWFEWEGESPFMLFTMGVLRPELVPGVVHVDGSSRVQTVCRDDNPLFYDLILEFEALTGVPMLLNTSLNLGGEPLVESFEDALRLFNDSRVDVLVFGDRMIIK